MVIYFRKLISGFLGKPVSDIHVNPNPTVVLISIETAV